MKTNENAKNIIIVIGSLIIATFTGILAYLVGKEIGKWGCQTIQLFAKWIEKIFNKNKLNALKPFLKEAIKKADHVSLDDIEKSTTIEVVDKDQVPERIREKIESYEEAQKASGTKTFINGKNINIITALTGANKIDQFIYDCKELKRSKIGSHRVPDDSVTSHWDKCYAKLIKKNLTQAEKDWAESFEFDGFTRSKALEFTNKYFTEVNNYIQHFKVNVEKVSFKETDSIVNKYFGEE